MVKNREEAKQQFAKRFNDALTAIGVPERGRMVKTAKIFNVSNSGAKKWLDGESIPDTFRMADFSRTLKVRAEWLLTGTRDENDIRIGSRIEDLRRKKVWHLPFAAKMCAMPMLRYCMIEKGEGRASVEELEAIAEAYKINDWQDLINLVPTVQKLKCVEAAEPHVIPWPEKIEDINIALVESIATRVSQSTGKPIAMVRNLIHEGIIEHYSVTPQMKKVAKAVAQDALNDLAKERGYALEGDEREEEYQALYETALDQQIQDNGTQPHDNDESKRIGGDS